MPIATPIDQLLRGRDYRADPSLDDRSILYSYTSPRLSYCILYNPVEGEMSIGADFVDGFPFGATSLFEVSLAVEELAFRETGGYGRPVVYGTSRLPDGTTITVIELMVRDDGELIVWPQGFAKLRNT